MRLRGLLKLLTSLAVIVPSSMSVVACNHTATDGKANLSTITSLTGVRFTLDTTKKYNYFDSFIAQAVEFNNKPITDYSVKYYATSDSQTEITDNLQTEAGTVYVVITAGNDDQNWQGSTSDTTRITLDVEGKNKLSNVESINDLSSGDYFNPTMAYSALDPIIKQSSAFTNDVLTDYTVKYYDAETGGNEITTDMQTDIKVYIVITAAEDDPLWQGSTSDTNRLSFTLNKLDLSTITALNGLNITLDSTKQYKDLDPMIRNATQFATHALADTDTITWYDSISGGADISADPQAGKTVYIVITAVNDPYWTGTSSDTSRIAVVVNKVNLDTLTTLSGLTINADPSKKYSDLDTTVATATEFATHNLAAGYTIDWYTNPTGGSTINSTNVKGSTVYVVIKANDNDPYWQGNTSDTTRIAVTINKINLSTITSLTGLDFTVDTTQNYSALDSQIASATEFATHTLSAGYSVTWYNQANGGTDVSNASQIGGTSYVVIHANANDPYWTGNTSETSRIPVSIKKVELNTIPTLSGLNINANTSETYQQLNQELKTATEFTAHPLAANFTVNWYQNATGGNPINDNYQAAGEVYVEITAATTDPYWTGTSSDTSRIAIELQ